MTDKGRHRVPRDARSGNDQRVDRQDLSEHNAGASHHQCGQWSQDEDTKVQFP